MIRSSLITALATPFFISASAYAQDPLIRTSIPDFDALRVAYTQTGDMDFDNGPGDVSVQQYDLQMFLSKPISLTSELTMVPFLTFAYTDLDVSNSAGFPIQDE